MKTIIAFCLLLTSIALAAPPPPILRNSATTNNPAKAPWTGVTSRPKLDPGTTDSTGVQSYSANAGLDSYAFGSSCTAAAPVGLGDPLIFSDSCISLGYLAHSEGRVAVSIGYITSAKADFAAAFGYQSSALNESSFVWSDGAVYSDRGPHQFCAHATGGYFFDGDGVFSVNSNRFTIDILGNVAAASFAGDGAGISNIAAATKANFANDVSTNKLPLASITNAGTAAYSNATAFVTLGTATNVAFVYAGMFTNINAGTVQPTNTMFTVPATGIYTLNAYVVVVGAGGASGTVTVDQEWTDMRGSATNTGATTASSSAVTRGAAQKVPMAMVGGSAFKLGVASTGSSYVYDVYWSVVKLQ